MESQWAKEDDRLSHHNQLVKPTTPVRIDVPGATACGVILYTRAPPRLRANPAAGTARSGDDDSNRFKVRT